MERLQAIDIFHTDFTAKLAEATGKVLSEIDTLFKNSVIEAHEFDRATFAERLNRFVADEKIGHLSAEDIKHRAFSAGIKPFVEYKENPFLQQLTKAMADQTKETFTNLTRTVGFTSKDGTFLPPRDMFTNALTLGEMKVVTGIADYNSVIRETVKDLGNSGLKTIAYPYAKPWSLEASVRANILTGISQLSSEITWKNAEDLGAKYVATTMHDGSRETHQPWQGRIFALNGSVTEIRAKADAIRETDAGVKAMRRAEISLQKQGNNDNISLSTVSGALNPNSPEAQRHAEQYYEAVRKMKTDINRIADNTGYSYEKIEKIKEHLFMKKHDLGGAAPEYFYPYYEIAQSWQRLIDGKNIQPRDYILLQHEYMEQDLMSRGFSQQEAHDATNKIYNYSEALRSR